MWVEFPWGEAFVAGAMVAAAVVSGPAECIRVAREAVA